MATHPPLVFKDINSEQYSKLAEQARAAGIEISGHKGTASKYGVEISWEYSPRDRQLTFHCLKTPFFVSAADVDKKIRSVVDKALAV